MKIPLFQIDAFTNQTFSGNPAAVCPLDTWLSDAQMQAIAAENNLSETAFFVRDGDHYALRWFTPAIEVDLCGHATLASAFVIFEELDPTLDVVVFETRSGRLLVKRDRERLTLDFPSHEAVPCQAPDTLLKSLHQAPREVLLSHNYLVVYDTESDVRSLQPDTALLSQLGRCGVIATAVGDEVDFVSRYFVPGAGIPEDPVTGSTHCTLTPYWSQRLGKTQFHARQISSRGGELWCELHGDRVLISGYAAKYLEGSIQL